MADYKGITTDLKARRNRLMDEVNRLDDIIRGLEQLSGGSAGGELLSSPNTLYRGMTLLAASQKALDLAAEPQTTQEIIQALKDGGLVLKAQRPYQSIYSTLFRLAQEDGPVSMLGRGRWGLRKWKS